MRFPFTSAAVAAAVLFASAPGGAQAPAPTGPAKRDAAVFAKLPAVESPRLSPNGKMIAAKIAAGGKQYFAVLPIGGGEPHLIGVGKNDLNWWRWVNDDWLVVGVGGKVPVGGDEWYVRRAIGVSADGTKMIPLLARDAAQGGDDVVWIADDGTPRVLLAIQKSIYSDSPDFWPSVYEVDVSTGRSKLAVGPREGVMSWSADSNGTVRMGVGRLQGGRVTRVIYRDGPDNGFRTIDKARTNEEPLAAPSLFLADPGKALILSDDAQGFSSVYEFDLKTLELGKQLYTSGGFDISTLIPTRHGDGLAGVQFDEDSSRTQWIDPEMVELQGEVSAMVKGGGVDITSYSRSLGRAIIWVGAPDSPGAYFLYNRSDKVMDFLAFENESIKMAKLNPVRTVRYKARDGLEIAAVLTLPKGKPAASLPLIMLPHGGPFARDSESWDWWVQFLAEKGYAVIQPNYRGSSGYGTAFAEKGEGEWGLAMQDDLLDAVTYLAKEGIADPKRVCIVGASYGGYAAMRGSQRDAAHYRCAVSYAGVSDLDRMRRYDRQFLNSGARMDWLKKQAPDFKAVSPLFTPEQTAIPILLVHGKEDTVVPYAHSKEFAERLKKAGKDFVYIEQPLADHHFTRGEDRLEFLKALEAFLDKYNPA